MVWKRMAGPAAAAIGLLALALPMPALAQHRHEPCAAGEATLPAELAGWSARTPLPAAKRANALGKATLRIGEAVDARLARTPDVHYVQRPEKPGGTVSYGGLFAFDVAEAGTYRITLGSGAWIDVLDGERAVQSVAHGHGPACSGIRKMVDFPLAPGRYTLQVAANGDAALPVLVARLP